MEENQIQIKKEDEKEISFRKLNENSIEKQRKSKRCPVRFELSEEKCESDEYEEEDNRKLLMKSTEPLKEDTYEYILCKLIGIDNLDLLSKIIGDGVMNIFDCNTAEKHNIILQALVEQRPNDIHEARLSIQATVLHHQAMRYLNRAEQSLGDETFDKQGWNQIAMKNATRLLDLHAKTIETLIRYKQRGEQRITVQHVQVNDGGKAIVGGNLTMGGGGGGQQ